MPVISADKLREYVVAIFAAAGSPEPVAHRVADSLVESNLVGHDSHGVIRIPWYIESIQAGTLNPHGAIEIVRETTATALLDCGRNFGQVAASQGMDMAINKAREHGLGLVVLRHCDHTGRIGEYVVQAAEQRMMGQAWCNGSAPGGIVVPYGGIKTALGANPLAWGIPNGVGQPLFFDFATSVASHGKIQVAAAKGEKIPLGWLLDEHGNPTGNPNDIFSGGAMLPFGGHKGYALNVMIELTGGGLSGVGFPLLPGYRWAQGMVLVAVNIENFQPLDEFKQMVASFCARLKAIPRAPDHEEILLPGELEWRSKAARERDGIPLPEVIWDKINKIAGSLGISSQA